MFDRDLTEEREIEAGVQRMVDDVLNCCEPRQASGRTVTVKIKYAGCPQINRRGGQRTVVTIYEKLRQAAVDVVRSVFPAAKDIGLVRVTVSNFAEATVAGVERSTISAEAAVA